MTKIPKTSIELFEIVCFGTFGEFFQFSFYDSETSIIMIDKYLFDLFEIQRTIFHLHLRIVDF